MYALQSLLEKDTDFTYIIPRTDLNGLSLGFLFPRSIECEDQYPQAYLFSLDLNLDFLY